MNLRDADNSDASSPQSTGDGFVSVIDAAQILGLHRKQHLFKVLKRLGIQTRKERSSDHGGQAIAYIREDDLARIRDHLGERRNGVSIDKDASLEPNTTETGWFYLIQLEPQHDPSRFKVGFSSDLPQRLRHLRCSAPFATIVSKWRCKLLWEKTAIECVTTGCSRVHTEIFRAGSIDAVRKRCEMFFHLLEPALQTKEAAARNEPNKATP